MIVDRDGDFNFALLTCLPAGLALLVLTLHLLGPHEVSIGLVLVCIAVAAVFSAATALFVVEQSDEDQFRAWLLSSVAAIERGEAKYGDTPVSPNTELRVFEVPVGMVFLSFAVPLRPRFATDNDLPRIKKISTGLSLLTGWWSLFGLLRTPLSAYANLRGGTPTTVADYHAQLVGNGTASRFERGRDDEYATRLQRPPWDR